MLKKDIPLWVMLGGFLLTLIAGCINAVGFLGTYHQAVSHMSGTVTALGLDLAAADGALLLHTGIVVFSFFVGSLLSGFIIRQSALKVGRRYGAVLTLEAVLLVGAAHYLRADLRMGDYLAAMACGLQNAMATSYSGAVVRTTHVTGMITDLGIACGHMLRGQPVEWHRMRLYGVLLTGFVSGGYFGAISFARFSYDTLLFPATLAGLTGLGYALFKHVERQQHKRAKHPGQPAVSPAPARRAVPAPRLFPAE